MKQSYNDLHHLSSLFENNNKINKNTLKKIIITEISQLIENIKKYIVKVCITIPYSIHHIIEKYIINTEEYKYLMSLCDINGSLFFIIRIERIKIYNSYSKIYNDFINNDGRKLIEYITIINKKKIDIQELFKNTKTSCNFNDQFYTSNIIEYTDFFNDMDNYNDYIDKCFIECITNNLPVVIIEKIKSSIDFKDNNINIMGIKIYYHIYNLILKILWKNVKYNDIMNFINNKKTLKDHIEYRIKIYNYFYEIYTDFLSNEKYKLLIEYIYIINNIQQHINELSKYDNISLNLINDLNNQLYCLNTKKYIDYFDDNENYNHFIKKSFNEYGLLKYKI